MEAATEEIRKLRRTMREIIAISSLPSIWANYKVPQIADSLVETLCGSLGLQFAYASLTGGERRLDAGYGRNGFLTEQALAELKSQLAPLIQSENPALPSLHLKIRDPFGEAKTQLLQLAVLPIGHGFRHGVLILASTRENFPSESERLVLNIAANQLNVTAQQQWAQDRAKSLLALAEEKSSQLKETEANLQLALEVAESAKTEAVNANELKTTFLANMSHEIRTPLGAILGFTEILKSSELKSDERHDYLEIIHRSGQSLTRIIDDILDLSKIEAGKLEIESEALYLPELCREVIAMFMDRANGKGIALELDDAGLPTFAIGSDQVRIRQILVNLIGNAIKFTSQGHVRLTGDYSETKDGAWHVSISVDDTGIGMSQASAEQLFQPFHQADSTSTRRFGGTGLGLALSRKLGAALGGDVRLMRCEEGRGCTFKFDFLAGQLSVPPALTRETRQSKVDSVRRLNGCKVLVADDSPDNRLLIEILLKKQGAIVAFAADGEEAVKKCLTESYDAVLMDIQMPILDGYGALAKLRRENFRKPIIALTAHAMKEERNRAIASGFADHVSKPVKASDLVETLVLHLKR